MKAARARTAEAPPPGGVRRRSPWRASAHAPGALLPTSFHTADSTTPFTLPKALLERPIHVSRALAGTPDLRAALGGEPTIVVFVRHLG